ncbi:hypothetical protein O3M35_006055 [Rhynocoris fuscipes]|uniref:Uncharacterized protein n=1 Tax=Rhynocoris fuscipes TaxID=488301 RepID=A0AAW1DJ69_9HEMI
MREKPLWLCILIIITLGAVKAHIHMLRMLIMAAAGLAGLYMLHLLAQDFQKIRQSFGRSAGLNTILKTSGIGKRSTSDVRMRFNQ